MHFSDQRAAATGGEHCDCCRACIADSRDTLCKDFLVVIAHICDYCMSADVSSFDTPEGVYTRVDWVNPQLGLRAGMNVAIPFVPSVVPYPPRLSAVTLRQTKTLGHVPFTTDTGVGAGRSSAAMEPVLVSYGIDIAASSSGRSARGTFGTRSKSGRPKNAMRTSGSTLISRVSTSGDIRAQLSPRHDTTVTVRDMAD